MTSPDFHYILEEFDRYNYTYKSRYRELNLIGFRRISGEFNTWKDYLGAFWFEGTQPYFKLFPGTTVPGRYYLIDKFLNPKGCAVMLPGQYVDSYQLGKHKGKEAFVQRSKIRYFRDNNKNSIIDNAGGVFDDIIGLNIHTTHGVFPFVNKYSAGCQVYQDPQQFEWVLELAREHADRYGNKFNYTLMTYR
jgi:hypothetical protein